MTVLKIVASIFFLGITGCGAFDRSQNAHIKSAMPWPHASSLNKANDFESGNLVVSAAKLREYCKACHAVGNLRFIWSESDDELWAYIFANNPPNRSGLWAESIYEALNWPSSSPPASFPIMDPPNNRDWMPKGSKRLSFADDSVDGTQVRLIILDALKKDLSHRP